MNLNPQIIRDSFALAVPIADDVAARFYQYLFADYPQVKPLFAKIDPPAQRQKLIQSLVYIVGHLEKSDRLATYLKNMGSRHLYYGVEESHYDAVGATLLKTFESFLGAQFTPEIREQWTIAFGIIKTTMLQGAREHQAKRPAA